MFFKNYKDVNNNSEDLKVKKELSIAINIIKNVFKKRQIINDTTKEEKIFEIKRKCFHLILGILLPVLTIYIEKKVAIITLLFIAIPFIIIDYNNLSMVLKKIPRGNFIIQLFREYEMIYGQLCGLSWVFIGCLIVLSNFDRYFVSLSMAILIFCDASSALIGKNFGRIKICGKKTLEGTLAFFIIGIIVIFIYQKYIFPSNLSLKTSYLLTSLFVSSIVELVAKNIMLDDNFAIPVSFCFTYKVLETVF